MSGTVQDPRVERVGTWHDDWPVAVLAAVGAAVVWVAARLAGVDVAVRSGSGSREIGLVSVVVTALVVAVAGAGLLRVLVRRTPRGMRIWTGIALGIWVVSLAGPAGAATLSAGLTLAAMHLVVGGVIIIGLRRVHASRAAERVA
jgi:hypothetical protein